MSEMRSIGALLLVLLLTATSVRAAGDPIADDILTALNGADLRSIGERIADGEDVVEQYGNISLINFGGGFSEDLLREKGEKLATIPGYDVRLAYGIDYIQTDSRFERYENEGIVDHLKEPYRRADGEITQENLDLMSSGYQQFIGRHFQTWFNPNSIHIAYMALVFLNGEGGAEYKLDRYLMFGGSVVRVDRIKAKQVRSLVGFDLAAENNDAYIQDYVDELYRAMTDRNYVITGSVSYKGIQYLNNDTIYVDDNQEAVVSNFSANDPAELQFGVNSRDEVGQVSWREVSTAANYVSMLDQNEGRTVAARFHYSHYEQLNRIDVEYGDGRSTAFHILPINLKIDPAKDEFEAREGEVLSFSVRNNHLDFSLPPNTVVNLRSAGYPDDDVPFEEYSYGPGESSIYEWEPDPQRCGNLRLRADFYHVFSVDNSRAYGYSDRIKIKCKFKLSDLEAIPYTYGSETEAFYEQPDRRAKAGETIYFVVSNGNRAERKIKVTGLYEGRQPESNSYWHYGVSQNGVVPSQREPRWDYSVDTDDREVKFSRNQRTMTFSEDYFPAVFEWPSLSDAWDALDMFSPSTYIDVLRNLDFSGVNDVDLYEDIIIYEAFGQQRAVSGGFLWENRRSYKLSKFPLKLGKSFTSVGETITERTDMREKAKKKKADMAEAFAEYERSEDERYQNAEYWQVPPGPPPEPAPPKPRSGVFGPFKFTWDAGVSLYNFEDPKSPSYRQMVKPSIEVGFGAKTPEIPIFGWNTPIVKAQFYVKADGSVGVSGAVDISKDHEEPWAIESMKLEKGSVEGYGKIKFTGGGNAGFGDRVEQATRHLFELYADGSMSYPFETKLKYALPIGTSFTGLSDGKATLELNHGPAVFTLTLKVKLTALDRIPFLSGWDWDVVDVTYPWTLSTKRNERWRIERDDNGEWTISPHDL